MTTSKREDLRRFRRRRVTLSQLAAQLEVSTATVSLALRDNPAVSAETRKRVQALAAEMGYIYNRQAASLRTARTDIVGVVVHDVLNPYFAEVFRAVESELETYGLTILICNHRDSIERQRNFVQVLQQQLPEPGDALGIEDADEVAADGLARGREIDLKRRAGDRCGASTQEGGRKQENGRRGFHGDESGNRLRLMPENAV